MNLIKKFMSKIFAPNVQTDTEFENHNAEQLKAATRKAFMEAFPQNTKENLNINHIAKENFCHSPAFKILEEYNDSFFKAFNIPKTQYKLKLEKQNIIVQVDDKDFEENLSKSDKLSLAYEHIFIRMIQKEFKNFEYRLSLRAGDSYHKHQMHIKGIAKKLATKVKQSKQKISVSSKSSYERSLIHKTVESIPGVASKSVGPYHQRRLLLYPTQSVTESKMDSKVKAQDNISPGSQNVDE